MGVFLVGGSGGGAVRLAVANNALIDGDIVADGADAVAGNAGGGSGGTVSISANRILGAGRISADGGNGRGTGGGGAGGRIALISTDSPDPFLGRVSAKGGLGGGTAGGAGTIYTDFSASVGQIIVDNGGRAGTNTSVVPLPGTVDLSLSDGALLAWPSGVQVRNLLIRSNAWLVGSNQTIGVTGTAWIQSGGGISADGSGYRAGSSYSAGTITNEAGVESGGGGGHAGLGASSASGAAGGLFSGCMTAPADAGGAGGGTHADCRGGAGGGVLNLAVTGNLLLDGQVSADGLPGGGNGGGGAGGSVVVSASRLFGTGRISANGGAGAGEGGGGGGGQVLLTTASPGMAFAGSVMARGGTGGGPLAGGAGTLCLYLAGEQPEVVVENGGHAGAMTLLWPRSVPELALKIDAGAAARPAAYNSVSVRSAYVGSEGAMKAQPGSYRLDVHASEEITVASGGAITADYAGYAGGLGPGAGVYTNDVGSGAGYGEQGGASSWSPGARPTARSSIQWIVGAVAELPNRVRPSHKAAEFLNSAPEQR